MARKPTSKSRKPPTKPASTKSAPRPKHAGPTFASVTSTPCSCKYLEHSADDPTIPIAFDEKTNEYHYQYYEPGSHGLSTLNIYHCPFCGGAAPKSKRHLLFHVIPPKEMRRLTDLIGTVATFEEVIRKLGKPDFDDLQGLESRHEDGDRPPTMRRSRTLQYSRFSDVAQVWFSERPDGRISWQLVGKERGRDDANTAKRR
ncbi:MAG: hypothetical protein HEQ23_05800 [Tepidisphaera sp.]